MNQMCPACANKIHSTAHVIEECHRTFEARRKSHDTIAKYLRTALAKHGYEVFWEPAITSSTSRPLKPDLIAVRPSDVKVMDVSIISDNYDLDRAYVNKVDKYSACIINWRGAVALKTKSFMKDALTVNNYKIMSVRTLQCGVYGWDIWQKTTTNLPDEREDEQDS